jgi:uncharacterized protein (UPF0212 family)
MTITKQTHYGIECDECGEEYDSAIFYSDDACVLLDAIDEGWKLDNGKHYCPKCQEEKENN